MKDFAEVERAIAEIAAGRPVVVVGDQDTATEGHLVFAAEMATSDMVAFMVRYTFGYIRVAVTSTDADRMDLPPMHHSNDDPRGTAYTVAVDAKDGIGTGISAFDRAKTIALLADPTAGSTAFTRPGHVIPLRAAEGGVLRRPRPEEAAVDLAQLAGLHPAGACCEIVSQHNPGDLAGDDELRAFADTHGLAFVTIGDLLGYRLRNEVQIERVGEARMPLIHGDFRGVGYRCAIDDIEHIAFVSGDIGDGKDVLVRIHSECLAGDAFGSLRCDCGFRLHAALSTIGAEGRGVVVYLRNHGNRGIETLAACCSQNEGADTVGVPSTPAGDRAIGMSAQILTEIGVESVRLLGGDPVTSRVLVDFGLELVGCASLPGDGESLGVGGFGLFLSGSTTAGIQ